MLRNAPVASRTRLFTSTLLPAAALMLGFACGHAWAQPVAPSVPPFSGNAVGEALPKGWGEVRLNGSKTLTHYTLVDDAGVVVLHAQADNAASGLGHEFSPDLRETPVVHWRWKTAHLIPGADNKVASREDSPTRLIFQFDGDKKKLSFSDQTIFTLSRFASGRELPYATLIYIWSNTLPIGEVVNDPLTNRIRMIVVSSGAAHVGEWQELSRNVVDDFQHAFGEMPGKVLAVGVMTDTDNTGATAESWYGDISLAPAAH